MVSELNLLFKNCGGVSSTFLLPYVGRIFKMCLDNSSWGVRNMSKILKEMAGESPPPPHPPTPASRLEGPRPLLDSATTVIGIWKMGNDLAKSPLGLVFKRVGPYR